MRQFFSNHRVKFEDPTDVDLEKNTFGIEVVLERTERDCLLIMNSWNCTLL